MTRIRRKGPDQGGKWIRPDKRLAIYLRDGMCCAYCNASHDADGAALTLDHLVPCEAGGTNKAHNLVTACRSCNSSKSARSVRAFYVVLRDRGINTDRVGPRVRRLVRKPLKKFRLQAKAIIAERDAR